MLPGIENIAAAEVYQNNVAVHFNHYIFRLHVTVGNPVSKSLFAKEPKGNHTCEWSQLRRGSRPHRNEPLPSPFSVLHWKIDRIHHARKHSWRNLKITTNEISLFMLTHKLVVLESAEKFRNSIMSLPLKVQIFHDFQFPQSLENHVVFDDMHLFYDFHSVAGDGIRSLVGIPCQVYLNRCWLRVFVVSYRAVWSFSEGAKKVKLTGSLAFDKEVLGLANILRDPFHWVSLFVVILRVLHVLIFLQKRKALLMFANCREEGNNKNEGDAFYLPMELFSHDLRNLFSFTAKLQTVLLMMKRGDLEGASFSPQDFGTLWNVLFHTMYIRLFLWLVPCPEDRPNN